MHAISYGKQIAASSVEIFDWMHKWGGESLYLWANGNSSEAFEGS